MSQSNSRVQRIAAPGIPQHHADEPPDPHPPDYHELLELLRRDLQLDATIDLQPLTVLPAWMPQAGFTIADAGQFQMPFAGTAGPVNVTVNHRLSKVPQLVLALYSYAGSVGLSVYEAGRSITQLTLRGVATAAVAGNVSGYWMVIG